MFCFKCGYNMNDNTAICPVCGANQNENKAAHMQQPTYQQPQQMQRPQQAYQQPQQGYQNPQQGYQQPQQGYHQPQQGYQNPQQGYQQPQQGYQNPQHTQSPMQQGYLPSMQNNPYAQKPKKNIFMPIIIAIVALVLVAGAVLITLAATGVIGGDSGSSRSDRDRDDDDDDDDEDSDKDDEDEDQNDNDDDHNNDDDDNNNSNHNRPSSETEMIMGAWYGEDITNSFVPEYVFCEYGLHGEGDWYEFEVIEEYDVIIYGEPYNNLTNALQYTVTEDTLYLDIGTSLTSGEGFQSDGGSLDLKRCDIVSQKNTTQGLWYVTSGGEATIFNMTEDTIYACGDEESLSFEVDGNTIYCSDYIIDCAMSSNAMTWDFYYMDGDDMVYDFTYEYIRIE